MKDRPLTDIHEITKKEVANHMAPLLEATFEGEERLARKIDKLERLVIRLSDTRHEWVQDAAIAILFIVMMVTRGCWG